MVPSLNLGTGNNFMERTGMNGSVTSGLSAAGRAIMEGTMVKTIEAQRHFVSKHSTERQVFSQMSGS